MGSDRICIFDDPVTDQHRNSIRRRKRHHIPDRVLLDEMVRERVRVKVFPQIIPDQP